jgi:hypothetical protein
MPNDRPIVRKGRILASPGPAVRASAFEPYVTAVGGLNYAWNNLHETLSQLFVAVASPALPNIILSFWHSTRSDWGQRDMLWLLWLPLQRIDGLHVCQTLAIL